MNEPRTSWQGTAGALIVTLIGVISFFLIIGVFGLSQAIVALATFVVVASLVFRLPQAGDDLP